MDFEYIIGQIKSQETLNKLHNEIALGSMLTRAMPMYNNWQHTKMMTISLSQCYKYIPCIFFQMKNDEIVELISRLI